MEDSSNWLPVRSNAAIWVDDWAKSAFSIYWCLYSVPNILLLGIEQGSLCILSFMCFAVYNALGRSQWLLGQRSASSTQHASHTIGIFKSGLFSLRTSLCYHSHSVLKLHTPGMQHLGDRGHVSRTTESCTIYSLQCKRRSTMMSLFGAAYQKWDFARAMDMVRFCTHPLF